MMDTTDPVIELPLEHVRERVSLLELAVQKLREAIAQLEIAAEKAKRAVADLDTRVTRVEARIAGASMVGSAAAYGLVKAVEHIVMTYLK